MDEFLATAGALGYVPMMHFSCMGNQVCIAWKLFLTVLTSVVVSIENIQSALIWYNTIKEILTLIANSQGKTSVSRLKFGRLYVHSIEQYLESGGKPASEPPQVLHDCSMCEHHKSILIMDYAFEMNKHDFVRNSYQNNCRYFRNPKNPANMLPICSITFAVFGASKVSLG